MEHEKLKQEFLNKLEGVKTEEELRKLRSEYLGPKGVVKELFKKLKEVPPELRRELGRRTNELKELIERLLKEKERELKQKLLQEKLKKEWADLTVPPPEPVGALHPVTQTIERIVSIFKGMGFKVAEGPEVEREDYNFDLLNIPPEHPARDMQDTFYVNKKGYLLRTHTSPVQIRTLLSQKPPVQIVAPGKVYRRDDDPTHSPMFHQVEGLVVNKEASFRHMKHTLESFLRTFFGADLPVRF
ncbi:MAG: phenylalanine--tRNA ligase subunit alpha, partial [Aquificae bacterium]|nr:phenylalanine--tRNA ligase subunit alpha [Aquificota bacterium]